MARQSFRDKLRDARDAYQSATATPDATDEKRWEQAQADDLEHADTAPAPPAAVAPVKRKWSTLPTAQFKGTDGHLQLYPDGVDHLHGLTRATIPLHTIQAVSIEDGADLEARITATRLVLIGVFALAFRKRKGGEKYLTIESSDAFTVLEVDRKSIANAQKFAAAVRTSVKGAQR